MALTIGVLGAGAIAAPYYMAMANWPQLRLKSCSSKGMASAEAAAAKYGIAAVSLPEMLADEEIDAVVNLTPIQAHYETSGQIIDSGKHLYSEKPLTATVAEARDLLARARDKGVRIGCAPDTFFGSAHQEARAAVDDGKIGKPIGGAVFLGASGTEMWHPKPEPFYAAGGGPVADHGPYYLAQLINLLGPVAAAMGMGSRPAPIRHLRNPARAGETLTVEVDTTAVGLLEFASGPLVTLAMSWDMGPHGRTPIEIYGSDGTLRNPDPNWSGGAVTVIGRNGTHELDHSARCFHQPTMISFQGAHVAYYRLCGLADMADAIASGRPHRASGELALHVIEVIEAIRTSSASGVRVAIESRCERPAPIGDDIANAATIQPFGEGLLDSRTLF